MAKTIGLIGVGTMGHGIAHAMLRAGFSVHFLNHVGNRDVSDLLAIGARGHDTLSGLAAQADRFLLCVTGAPEVRSILLGDDGLLAHLGKGSTVIDLSTSMPDVTRQLAETAGKGDVTFFDAAMTRTPKEAREGRLNLLVGGPTEVLASHGDIFDAIAENITHAGPVGSGHALKLLHNAVSLGFAAVLSETFAAARANSVADGALLEALRTGAGAGTVLERFVPYVSSGDSSAMKFSMSNAAKDMGYITAMASGDNILAAVSKAYCDCAEAGHADEPVPTLVEWFSRPAPATKP